ncbi:MAG: hypothetical protein WCI48_14140 [Bacteroidota bacterium]
MSEKHESNPILTLPSPDEPEPVSYTLRIGAVGHRHLKNPASVEAAIGKILKQISTSLANGMSDPYQPKTTRHTTWQNAESQLTWKVKKSLAKLKILPGKTPSNRQTNLHFHIISSLAKGADRIISRAAMEHLQASLQVILPFNLSEYRKDFDDPDDLNEFNELFEKAENKEKLIHSSFQSIYSHEDGYEQAGKELVDSCELLIAVWDGQPSNGKGGTAEIVEYACSVNRLVVWINAIDPEVPELIVTNIQKTEKVIDYEGNQYIKVLTHVIPQIPAGWSPRFMQVAEYNRDRAFRKKGFQRIFLEYQEKFESNGIKANLKPERLQPLLHSILPHFAKADYLALRYQKIHIRAAIWLYRLAAISVAIGVLQTLYAPDQTRWIALEIIALLGAVFLFRLSLIENWHEKWLNYRHLAERLRSLIFNSLIENQTSINETTKNLWLPFYPGPGGWVLDVFDKIKKEIPAFNIADEENDAITQFILISWIKDILASIKC